MKYDVVLQTIVQGTSILIFIIYEVISETQLIFNNIVETASMKVGINNHKNKI